MTSLERGRATCLLPTSKAHTEASHFSYDHCFLVYVTATRSRAANSERSALVQGKTIQSESSTEASSIRKVLETGCEREGDSRAE